MIHNKKYKNIKEAFDFNDAYNEPEVDDISNEVSGYLGPESLIDFVKQNLHSVTWEI